MIEDNVMTKDMKNFIKELGDLLKKHGAELEVVESQESYTSYPTGIEVTLDGKWDKSVNVIRALE